jgi:hypothetical protein
MSGPASDLYARRAQARRRYQARHQADELLADPELVACDVALPAYLEPAAHLVPKPLSREEQDRRDIADCIRNKSHCRPGEARLSERV